METVVLNIHYFKPFSVTLFSIIFMTDYGDFKSIAIGFPSVIPPILAMVLALSTKEVISSLFVGVLSASIIYSIAVARDMVPDLESANVLDVMFTVMGQKISENISICLFILCIGALIHLVSVSGGAKAYASWAIRTIKGRRKSMFSTMALGLMLFLDDYFNSISTSTIMHPVTEGNRVSKAKTAYIVHTMSTNMCIMIPLTSWAAAIMSQIKDNGLDNPFVVFLSTIPFNIYSVLCFLFIIISISFDFDYGKMKFYEDNAKLGLNERNEDVSVSPKSESEPSTPNGKVWDLLLPILIMVILAVYFMYSFGKAKAPQGASIIDILSASDSSKSLLYACFVALLITLLMYVPRKLMTFNEWVNNVIEGMKTMLSTLMILVLAWSISGVSGDLLQTGPYVGQLVRDSHIPPQMIPAVVFLVGMALSFATGTAWGTFSLLIPIAIGICSGDNRDYLIPSIASCLCGAVFGNNTSPISDTTILVSTAVRCPFLMHVSTQLPYAATVAAVSIVGFLVAGFSHGNLLLMYLVAISLLIIILLCIFWYQKMHAVRSKEMEVEMTDLKKKGEDEEQEAEADKPVDNEKDIDTEITVVV